MPIAIFIARLLGPTFLVVGISLLSRPALFRVILGGFIESPVMLYLAGFLGFLGGLALVLTVNVWALDWRVILTLVGWVTLLRGLNTILRPEQIAAIGRGIIERRDVFYVAAAMDLLIGGILCYSGYLAAPR